MEKSFINNLNSEEQELLQQILIICTCRISNFLTQHNSPKKYAEYLAHHIDKKKYLISTKLFAELPNMNSDILYRQLDLKKVISLDNITDSTLSKVYTEFVNRKLLKNITSKKDIKDFRTKEFHTKGTKNTYKTSGRISYYAKEPKIDKVIEILSKPGASEYITSTITKFDNRLIDKFLKFYIISIIYLIPHPSTSLEFYVKSLSNYYKNMQLDFNTFDEFKNAFSSIPEHQIEMIAERLVETYKKVFGSSFLIIILSLL